MPIDPKQPLLKCSTHTNFRKEARDKRMFPPAWNELSAEEQLEHCKTQIEILIAQLNNEQLMSHDKDMKIRELQNELYELQDSFRITYRELRELKGK